MEKPTAAPSEEKSKALVSGWLEELEASRKREKGWRKDAGAAVELYEAERREESPFNILFSNTETLAPALYNTVPRPVVKRRFNDADPLGKASSAVCQRLLEFLTDTDMRDYPSFDGLLESAVQEALVPGRGVTWFKYDPTFKATETGEPTAPAKSAEDVEEFEVVAGEYVCGESVPWNRFYHGYAKKWADVPWVAREHLMTLEELVQTFGEDLAGKVKLQPVRECEEDSDSPSMMDSEDTVELGQVFEIWDKAHRQVLFISPGYPDEPLKVTDDPLELSGFFPCPQPLLLTRRISSLLPVTLYAFYEQQARELNRITLRIQAITKALKVRGFYDSTVAGMDKVLEAGDNVLLPAENVAALQQGQSLEKAIWLMPLEKLVVVLQQLYINRDAIKQTIYEITGIADIMRGSSVASETLGAQQLKNQWGTLRLKRSQKRVAVYARDCLRIMAEIAVSKLSPDTVRAMTGLKFPMAAEKAQAQQLAQQSAMAQQPPPPEVAETLAKPTLEELLAMLGDDLQRAYRIDIETNSTVDAEATEDKADMGELMNAIAQFLNGVAPAVEQGILPFDAAKAILLGVVRRYRFGSEVEDMLLTMQAPKPPAPEEDPKVKAELAKQEQALQKLMADVEKAKQELQFAQQDFERKVESAQKELQLKQQYMEREFQLRTQMEAERQKLQLDFAAARLDDRETKVAEQVKKVESLPPEPQIDIEAIAMPIVQALTAGLTQAVEEIREAVTAAQQTPRRAKKLADGSWTTY